MSRSTVDPLEKIRRRLLPQGECLVWQGATNSRGYGVVRINGKLDLVHRVVYKRCTGPIAEGHQVHHTCHVRKCANYIHLWSIPRAENATDNDGPTGINKRQTHCYAGHPLPPPGANGKRRCLPCAKYWQDTRRREKAFKNTVS